MPRILEVLKLQAAPAPLPADELRGVERNLTFAFPGSYRDILSNWGLGRLFGEFALSVPTGAEFVDRGWFAREWERIDPSAKRTVPIPNMTKDQWDGVFTFARCDRTVLAWSTTEARGEECPVLLLELDAGVCVRFASLHEMVSRLDTIETHPKGTNWGLSPIFVAASQPRIDHRGRFVDAIVRNDEAAAGAAVDAYLRDRCGYVVWKNVLDALVEIEPRVQDASLECWRDWFARASQVFRRTLRPLADKYRLEEAQSLVASGRRFSEFVEVEGDLPDGLRLEVAPGMDGDLSYLRVVLHGRRTSRCTISLVGQSAAGRNGPWKGVMEADVGSEPVEICQAFGEFLPRRLRATHTKAR